jgi:hypothetical protein
MHTGQTLPDGRENLFSPFRSLDAPLVDPKTSLEAPGNARLYAQPGIGAFMIGSGEDPSITRYELAADGQFIKGDTVSFANQGVTTMDYRAVVFVSATKAYYRDGTQLQLIAFNPSAMTITQVIPMKGLDKTGYTAGFGAAVTRDNGVFFPVFYFDSKNYDRVPSGATLVHVDTNTNAVTVTTDDRCTGMDVSMTSEAGDTYWFSSGLNTVAWRGYGLDHGVHDCALRLKKGAETFDPTWSLDLTTRTAGWAAVAMMPGGGSTIWLRVLDETQVTVPSPADYATFFGLPDCQWYALDVTSEDDAQRNDDRPLASCGGGGFFVDGRAFTYESSDSYASSTLLELTRQGFEPRGKFTGFILEVARMR